ncbi:DUF99 family protein [Candidatus Woesearchaeota archaeon]|nr:DUF99 family protein [Candidatus Woesearchaeota archaeon]
MKNQIRIIGIDDSPFDKFRDKKTRVIGTVFRGGDFMDGILSIEVDVDGNNSTEKLTNMIINSKFYTQIRAVFLDGIALAGFNIVDIKKLNKNTKIPVIVIMRHYPNKRKIKQTLRKINMEEKIGIIEKAGKIFPHKKIYFQKTGIDENQAKNIIDISTTHSYIPEPIRVAHMIGQGIAFGESRGGS